MLKLLFFLIITINLNLKADEKKEASLDVFMFESRPLYYQENNELKGIWYDKYQELSSLAGIKFNYITASSTRIEKLLRSNNPGCALHFLQTANRLELLKYQEIVTYKEDAVFKIYKNVADKRSFSMKKLRSGNFSLVVNSLVGKEVANEFGFKVDLLYNIDSIINLLTLKKIDAFIAVDLAAERTSAFIDKKIVVESVLKKYKSGIVCTASTPEDIVKKLRAVSAKWIF